MQRRHTTLVEGIRIRACFDEVGDYVTLCRRIPVLGAGTSVGRVVEGFSAPPVTRAHVGAFFDEQLGDTSLVRGGSDVQRRVAGVDVVMDRDKKVSVGIVATRPTANRTGHELRRGVQPLHDLAMIVRRNRMEERQQRVVVGVTARLICHRGIISNHWSSQRADHILHEVLEPLVERFRRASQSDDVDAPVPWLTEDARIAMPPMPFEWHARPA